MGRPNLRRRSEADVWREKRKYGKKTNNEAKWAGFDIRLRGIRAGEAGKGKRRGVSDPGQRFPRELDRVFAFSWADLYAMHRVVFCFGCFAVSARNIIVTEKP